MEYKIGEIMEGTISGIQPYGAFVALDEKVQGLIHISEVQSGYTKSIQTILTIGDKVQVQIIDIDEFSKKISLSLRTLEPTQPTPVFHRKRYYTNKNKKIGFESLEKALPGWIEDDLDRLLDEAEA